MTKPQTTLAELDDIERRAMECDGHYLSWDWPNVPETLRLIHDCRLLHAVIPKDEDHEWLSLADKLTADGALLASHMPLLIAEVERLTDLHGLLTGALSESETEIERLRGQLATAETLIAEWRNVPRGKFQWIVPQEKP